MLENVKDKNGKIWLAGIAGFSAGLIGGLLMAPESGQDTRASLKSAALAYGDQLEQLTQRLKRRLTGEKEPQLGSTLTMHGSWEDVKERLQTQYGDLTDEDLTYEEGQEDSFLNKLEFKLGKGKKELRRIIAGI